MKKLSTLIIVLVLLILLSSCLQSFDLEIRMEINEDGQSYCVVENHGKFAAYESNLNIPSTYNDLPVTRIDTEAFYDVISIGTVSIPHTIEEIGERAFSKCTSLRDINVDENNQYYSSIDGNLYSKDGTKLIQYACGKEENTFVLPSFVTEIESYAFFNCPNLKNIEVEDGNQHFQSIDGVLYSIDGDKLIYHPEAKNSTSYNVIESVKYIESYAFYNCASITSISIPKATQVIGERVFERCANLKEVVFESDSELCELGKYSFLLCESLINIDIPDGVKEIGEFSFHTCSALESVDFPSELEYVGEYAFAWCKSLKSVNIPNKTTVIDTWAFSECTSLHSVKLSETLEIIGNGAFRNCTSLKSIDIPSSLKEMGTAFSGCEKMTYNEYNNAFYLGNDSNPYHVLVFADNTIKECNISNKTVVIAADAFNNCFRLQEIDIPDSVVYVGRSAFCNCRLLKQIKLSSSITKIGYYTFGFCGSMKNIVIPDSVTSIEGCAFSDCTRLETVTIPKSVERIRFNAFRDCENLKAIYFEGTIAEWNAIDKELGFEYDHWNKNTGEYKVYCSDGVVDK